MPFLRVNLVLSLLLCTSLYATDVCGDCDGSGATTILDALVAAGTAAGGAPIAGSLEACDVDADGILTILDSLAIAQSAAGMPAALGCVFAPPAPPPTPGTLATWLPTTPPPAARDWVRAQPIASPPARGMAALAYDSQRHRSVLFGGSPDGGSTTLNDTWLYNGITWTQATPDTSPPARAEHAMVYDSARDVVVMFGGQTFWGGGAVGSETWEWNGANWTQKFPATAPSSRGGHAMVFDAARGVVVLWGGHGSGGYDDAVWEYNGTTWTQHTSPSRPTGGYWHAMTYDTARQRTVLLGGSHCPTLAQTWEWDGAAWTQILPTTPPVQREQHAMAYDSIHSQTILFGGSFTYGATYTETWDGQNWSTYTPPTAPSSRGGHSMTFDTDRGKVILFGAGDWYTSALADTWEF